MIKAHYLAFSIIFCGLFFSTSSSLAGIYKWVDDQGNTHYGSQPPPNTSRQKMDVQRYAPRDTSSYAKPGAKKIDEKADATEKSAEPAQEEKIEQQPKEVVESKADKKRRLAACTSARNSLSKMQSTGRIRQKDKDGNINYLSDKQKNASMKQLRNSISKHCK